ncbi:PREDICTED: death-associated protein 1 isoform X1 [Crocodylus porosus]|uniref:death-associated protein 1 isoform X1 n=1 Tax=Crocodylus porosus TaxID=8502 RepID=UPI00093BD402|nr:PREDICTED: death-associated protein 1 isoform X1 [Crocodylus porosus]
MPGSRAPVPRSWVGACWQPGPGMQAAVDPPVSPPPLWFFFFGQVLPRPRKKFAVKAGGMRIVQKHPHTSDSKEDKDKDDQDWETTSPPKPTVFISGVIARGDKDFPPAAAQVAHQKPHPSVEKLPNPQHVNQHIHQPRK